MSIAPPGHRTRLAIVTMLACGGLLATSTAATVFVAGEPQRRLAEGHHRLWELGNNPVDHRLLRIALDTTLAPSVRIATLHYVVDGVCLSEREVIFGPSAKRHGAIDTLLWAMRDVSGTPALRDRHHRMLDQIQNNAADLHNGARVNASWPAALMRLVVPKAVIERVEYCRTIG